MAANSTPIDPSKTYNALQSIDKAWADLRKARGAKDIDTDEAVFKPILTSGDLLKLLKDGIKNEGQGLKFGFWLLHKHYDLKSGERMVEIDSSQLSADVKSIALPAPKNDKTQVVERWGSDGAGKEAKLLDLEYKERDSTSSSNTEPPTKNFFDKFNSIMDDLHVPNLFGICLATSESAVPLEEQPLGDPVFRMQVTKKVAKQSQATTNSSIYDSVWSPTSSRIVCIQRCVCTTNGPKSSTTQRSA